MNWDHFLSYPSVESPGSGYDYGTISPGNVAVNAGGNEASLDAGGGNFIFNSAYFTGAWNEGLQLRIDGYNGFNQVYTTTLTLSATSPFHFVANWSGLTSMVFNSYGGVDTGTIGSGTHFAMDNLTLNERIPAVPEPGTWAMMIIGFGATGAMLRAARGRGGALTA